MSAPRIKKVRRKQMRSYRKAKLFLWAFGSAGLGLGVVLIGWGLLTGHMFWKLGVVYVLLAAILLGIRGILVHLDDGRKRRGSFRSGPRPSL